MKALILLIFTIASVPALALVENITHGYTSCLACHISPTGGGVLTDYGRSLSRELMSTWGSEGTENPLGGLIENKDNLKYGGDIRILQSYFENDQIKRGKLFVMQQNLELAYRAGKAWLVSTFGTQEGPEGIPGKGQFLSERHYAMWDVSDEVKVRIGKFRLAFGLNDPNHTRYSKAALGFGPNSESYNLEVSNNQEDQELFLTASLGRLDRVLDESSEHSLSFTFAHNIGSNGKTGISLLLGESYDTRRSAAAGFALLPIANNGIFKGEVDFQHSMNRAGSSEIKDVLALSLTGAYSFTQGVIGYLAYDYLQQSEANDSTDTSAGIGLQWLPIPHLELQAEMRRENLGSVPTVGESYVGWLLMHIYL